MWLRVVSNFLCYVQQTSSSGVVIVSLCLDKHILTEMLVLSWSRAMGARDILEVLAYPDLHLLLDRQYYNATLKQGVIPPRKRKMKP